MTAVAKSYGRLSHLQWAAAYRPLSGEKVSGDRHLVAPFQGGVLVAVVDALGHGTDADVAARIAVETLNAKKGASLEIVLKECHQMLSRTRGVAAAVASIRFADSSMSWIAIGNVEGVLLRSSPETRRQSVIQHGGIVGYKMPRNPPIETVRLGAGDRVCFATDGVKSGFAEALNASDPLPDLAADVLEKFGDVRDDALVLFTEYAGAEK